MRTIDDFECEENLYTRILNTIVGRLVRIYANWLIIPNRRKFDEDYKEHELIGKVMGRRLLEIISPLVAPVVTIVAWVEDHGVFGFPIRLVPLGSVVMRLLEELGRADSGIAVAFGCKLWPFLPILLQPHVNYEICKELAPYILFGCCAMTEPQGGSDIEDTLFQKGRSIQTTAELDGDEWVINGHKLWPTNSGGEAKLFSVVCTTNRGSDDPKDFAFIYVPADRPGVKQGEPYRKAGMAADRNSDIWFDDVRVPKSYRAFGPGDDYEYFGEIITLGCLGTVAFCSGVMLNIYEIIKEYCSKKTIAGRPLKEHPAVAAELAEIATKVQTARVASYRLARMIDNRWADRWQEEMRSKARLIKNFVADTTIEVAERAMDLMGLYGGDRNEDIEKHWRDVKMMQLWMGGKQLALAETARWFYECETV